MSKKVLSQSKLTTIELKNVLNHVIKNNLVIQKEGQVPVAINIVGDAGLGKTSVVDQVGQENGFKKENCVKLNLSQLDEIGDLIGIPVIEHQMIKTDVNGKTVGKWVKEKLTTLELENGFALTNKSRMGYAEPAWIVGKTGPGILFLDDYSRCSQRFAQAVMELISTQEYMSWKLPEGWTVMLSSNPDDGFYNVVDQDPAQKSRMLNVEVKWDAKIWADWAEKNKIDGRAINFVLLNPEIVGKDRSINPRSITLFFNSIKSIPNFEAQLDLIQCLGEGSLGVEATTLFTTFILNKLDKLITPEEILDTTVKFEVIEGKLNELINGKTYRADIANTLVTRLTNHILYSFDENKCDDLHMQRMKDLMLTKAVGTDLRYVFSSRSINNKSQYNVLLDDETILDMIIE